MKKQFFLVVLLAVFSLVLAEQNASAQEGISTYSTVNYDAANNTVSGYSYTYATYGNSGYYDTQVTSYIADSDDNVLDSGYNLGRLNASTLMATTGTGCGEYRIVSSHSAVVQYYATAYFYNNDYRDGYYDLFDYLQFSEQGQSSPLTASFFAPAVSSVRILDQSEIILGSTENTSSGNCVPPQVIGVTATGATRITQVVGNTNIFHFVTPKGAANSQITLSATIQYTDIHVPNHIEWEGAVESPNNPFEATLTKDAALKHTVRIKYKGTVIKELRVWVVWSEITSTSIPLNVSSTFTGDPTGEGAIASGGYDFTHTIYPTEIITDPNRPNFSGTNATSPPGGTHPIYGNSLAGGANRKWDNSRQIRFKFLNPGNVHPNDTGLWQYGQPANLLNYPASDVEGNDDIGTSDPETNDPYSNNGVLTGHDAPEFPIAHRGGVDGDTYEFRAHFREFTRLEIEGVWYRISDFYLWRIHLKFRKSGGIWRDNFTNKSLDNAGF